MNIIKEIWNKYEEKLQDYKFIYFDFSVSTESSRKALQTKSSPECFSFELSDERVHFSQLWLCWLF